jgi:hypothetical protein
LEEKVSWVRVHTSDSNILPREGLRCRGIGKICKQASSQDGYAMKKHLKNPQLSNGSESDQKVNKQSGNVKIYILTHLGPNLH